MNKNKPNVVGKNKQTNIRVDAIMNFTQINKTVRNRLKIITMA